MKKGDKVQNFTLQNSEGKNVSLSDLVSEGRALLLFFPLAFSSVCREELCTVKDNMKMYNSLHTMVAGISVDSFFTLNEFKKANNLNFTLISDFNREVSRQFNCLYEDYFGMKGVSKRSAFIVNKEMILEYAEILENSDLLPDFKAIQKALLR
jgi:glutaredoxin-dependent peroxiredoxin